MRGTRPAAALAVLLAALSACGDGLPPPKDVPPLPPPPLPGGPMADRPAPEDMLPEEGAAEALVRFLRALEKGEAKAASTYLDSDGSDQVRALRKELLHGGPKALKRIQTFFPKPESFTPKPRLLDENRVLFPLPMGPGGKRNIHAILHRQENGLWLLHLLEAVKED